MTAPALAADPILERMAGDWVARGFAKAAADGNREPAYCKTSNVLADDGASLTQSGRCAFGPDSGRFSSTLTAIGGGRYEGTSESPLVDGESSVTGNLRSGRLVLTSRGVTPAGETVEAETTIEVRDGGGYSLLTRRLDPDTGAYFEAVDLVFAPADE